MKSFLAYFKNASIRVKLILAYSFVFIAVLSVSSSILYYLTKRTIENNIESELQNSTASILNMVQAAANLSIRNHLQTIAEKNREIVSAIYDQALEGEITQEAAMQQAAEILLSQSIGNTGYIYCVNSEGILQVHPKLPRIPRDLSKFSFIQAQVKKKNGYIEYEWQNPDDSQERPKALYMVYFEPWDWILSVSSYREEFKDLISAEDFYESVMDLKFGKTGYSYVIDTLGNLLIHPAQPNVNIYDSQDSSGRYFIRQMIEERNGRIIYPWKNPGETTAREKLVIFNYLQEYDIIVASSSYLEEFYHPLKMVRYIFSASAAAAILLLLPVAMWLGNLISRPLVRAADRFRTAGEGDFSVRMDILSNDEIGIMAAGFNIFMEKLTNYRDELKDLNENLEIRVQERTAELKEAMSEVKQLSGLLPICSGCKKIRDDTGYWQQIESYISRHSEADFSHGICPACAKELYPELFKDENAGGQDDE